MSLLPAAGEREPSKSELFLELALPILDDLYRLACRLERDPSRAQDLLQEALLVGYRGLDQLHQRASFRAWAARIVYRLFLNSRRRPREEPFDADAPNPLIASSVPPLDPEERFLAHQRAGELRDALDELPSGQRLAVLLIDVQGFTYAEAAAVLDVAPGTVASRVVRGRAALRLRLRHLAPQGRTTR